MARLGVTRHRLHPDLPGPGPRAVAIRGGPPNSERRGQLGHRLTGGRKSAQLRLPIPDGASAAWWTCPVADRLPAATTGWVMGPSNRISFRIRASVRSTSTETLRTPSPQISEREHRLCRKPIDQRAKQEAAGVAAESPWDEGLVYHP